MVDRLEQRYCIKFCQKLGDSQVETIRKIQTAFGYDAMSSTHIKQWYDRLKDGHTSVKSESRSGRPSTCRNNHVNAEVNAVVMRDRRVTIREIAEDVGIRTFSAHFIKTEDLAMKRVAAKFVPKLLTVQQKQLRVEVSQDMLDSTNSDLDFMNTIITGDDSWVYGYDPVTESQLSQWTHSTSPRPKKAGQVCSNVKVILSAFFDSRGVAYVDAAAKTARADHKKALPINALGVKGVSIYYNLIEGETQAGTDEGTGDSKTTDSHQLRHRFIQLGQGFTIKKAMEIAQEEKRTDKIMQQLGVLQVDAVS
ncbi:histone-lysine N-methyltransferase SETMAR-like [Dermacentor andersoni]|uniref:histone-lysine N-methyltransferase SETMAR-like n=1 Tax=Dermacentor andersoni TaxID=34620 RepID=UPI003B3B74FE